MAAEPYRHSMQIAAEPEQVFEYFTKPEAIVRGRYLELEPPRRLVISWGHAGSKTLPPGASTVEITLTREAGGTMVRVVHSDLPELEARQHVLGWQHLPRAAGRGRRPPRSWPRPVGAD